MAIKSKYNNEQLDTLLNELITVLEKNKTPVDLSLMVLGNMVSNILLNNINDPEQREHLADTFSQALKNSLMTKH
ncbi:YejL family protein [Pasteurella atlantica]|uniref:YejL family protein n=3 Tax=Pasteurellaceae TaxID=712 RepID=A0ACC6HML9_9PAST|nr:YejL family protein [Pasteurella atlantica]MBR0573462.1 YejL family protein [Pasteurella atlantica]MDP8034000.1 YejL family protein [Pasteurella atlantica]MDP8035969.1 YejL family protein [Pasteurella atlantica]MDP8037919.1 YejL family protein [Pasteurella atlantica]MDP8039463.1 YejL family protein [Pasteurella atlantica]